MEIQEGFAEVNGTRLYYEVAGVGQPLVLIHGFTLDTRMWDYQFDVFAEKSRVVRYDVRGFGRSSPPQEKEYAHTDDLKALLDYLNISRAHILGLSMGGSIAINFALSYPEMLSALITVDSALGGYQMSQEFAHATELIQAKAKAGDLEGARAVWLDHPLFAPARENPAVKNELVRIVSEYSGWGWLNRNPLRTMNPPAIQQLNKIGIPTLVIVGERDLHHFHRIADILKQNIPNSRQVILPGVGHMSNMEDPKQFNEAVLSFLASK